jgi:hypothetical protein
VVAIRVVAAPDSLDRARWDNEQLGPGPEIRIRIAPDEALWIGPGRVDVDDPHAIVEDEAGFSMASLSADDRPRVVGRTEFEVPVPSADPAGTLVQGKVAGVPVKLVIGEPTLLIVQTAYADELERRLGWRS